MGQLNFYTSDIEKILDGRLHSPIQDCVGDNYTIGSPMTVLANTEYPFECNAATRNYKVFPSHITNIWDETLNVATFEDFLNTPEIVATPSFTFNPTVSANGNITVRMYINETVPVLLRTTTTNYKAIAEEVFSLFTFYAGEESGYDIKNKGVYFTFESEFAGELYDTSIEIYRT